MAMNPQILQALQGLASQLENVTTRLEKLEASGGSSGGGGGAPAPSSGGGAGVDASVAEWKSIMDNEVAAFVAAANAVGGEPAVAAQNAMGAFNAVTDLVDKASVCSKPSDLQAALGGISAALGTVSSQDKGRDRKDPNYMMIDFVQNGINCLTFVAYTERAWGAIEDNTDAMRYIGDKILMGYRKTGPATYITFENSYSAIWKKVLEYVKEHHPAGLRWQQGGIALADYTGPKAAGNTSAPAPKPAPAPAPKPAPKKKKVFNYQNKSAVAKEEENGRVSFDSIKLAYAVGDPQQKINRTIVVEHEKRDAVTIQDCENINIEIQGMPKALNITGCKKYHITVPGALASINVDNSSSGYMTLTGTCKTMQVDKVVGLDVTVQEPAYGCTFISSKVSGFNIGIEKQGDEGPEYINLAVPDQFETSMSMDADGMPSLSTTTMEHAGC